MTDRIDQIVNECNGPVVLDLGCVQHDASKETEGDWLHGRLVDEFETVIGVDYLEDEVKKLNRRGYDVRHADVEQMDLEIQADTITAGELIEHVSNPGLMLDRIGEHLKADGQVILSTPNPWAIVHLRRHLHNTFQINDEHTGWYGPTTLRQLLDRHGFTTLSIEGVGPPHKGLTGIAQKFGSDIFGSTTWLVTAKRSW